MEIGDVVTLKSGGDQKMTVNNLKGRMVECSWFSNGQLNIRDFPADSLREENRDSKNENMLLG